MREGASVPQLLSSQLESLYSSFVQSRTRNYCDMQKACEEWFNFYKGKADLADVEVLYSIKDEIRNKFETLQVKKFTMYVNDVYQEFKRSQTEHSNLEYLVNLSEFLAEFYEKNLVYETNNMPAYNESKINSYVLLSFYYSKVKSMLEFARITVDTGKRQKSLNFDKNFSNLSSNVALSMEIQNIGHMAQRIITDANDDIINMGDLTDSIERYDGTFESNVTLNKLKPQGLKEAEGKDENCGNDEGYDFLRKTCDNLELDKHNLELVLEKLKTDYKKLKSEVVELKQTRNQQVQTIESLSLELQEYKEENSRLKEQVNTGNTRMCNLFCENQELKKVKEDFVELETKYNMEVIQGKARIESAVESTKLMMEQEKEALVRSHQKDLKNCNKIIDNLEKRLETEMQKVRTTYENKLAVVAKDHSKGINKLKTEVCILTSENENLKSKLDELEAERQNQLNVIQTRLNASAKIENNAEDPKLSNTGDIEAMKALNDKALQTSFNDDKQTEKKQINQPSSSFLSKLKKNYLCYIADTNKKADKVQGTKSKSENKSMTTDLHNDIAGSNPNNTTEESRKKGIKNRANSLKQLNKELKTMKEVIKSINNKVSLKHLKLKTKPAPVANPTSQTPVQFIKRYSVVCRVKRSMNEFKDPCRTLNK